MCRYVDKRFDPVQTLAKWACYLFAESERFLKTESFAGLRIKLGRYVPKWPNMTIETGKWLQAILRSVKESLAYRNILEKPGFARFGTSLAA